MAFTYTNELVLQLIQAYKNYELLWDPSNPDFKNRTKKNDAWDDIANSMSIPRREVESKMHTIRSQFALKNNQNDELSESYQVESVQIAAPFPILYGSTDSTTPNLSTSRKRTNSYDDKSDDTMGFASANQFRPSQKSGSDEFEVFAQYVASELRETKDLHSVLMAKHFINDILFNARMGKYRKDGSVSFNGERKGIKAELTSNHYSDVNDDE